MPAGAGTEMRHATEQEASPTVYQVCTQARRRFASCRVGISVAALHILPPSITCEKRPWQNTGPRGASVHVAVLTHDALCRDMYSPSL